MRLKKYSFIKMTSMDEYLGTQRFQGKQKGSKDRIRIEPKAQRIEKIDKLWREETGGAW